MEKYLKNYKFWIAVIVIVIIIILIICCFTMMMNRNQYYYNPYYERMDNINDSVKYNVKFISNWGSNKREINYPKDPHTGNMLLLTHNNQFNLFELGKLSSKGISNTSMFGTIDDLLSMINNQPNVKNIYTSKVLFTPGEKTFSINAD